MSLFRSHSADVFLLCSCKKYDYDSSTVRKKFFREALLQIIIPYILQQLSPTCSPVSSATTAATLPHHSCSVSLYTSCLFRLDVVQTSTQISDGSVKNKSCSSPLFNTPEGINPLPSWFWCRTITCNGKYSPPCWLGWTLACYNETWWLLEHYYWFSFYLQCDIPVV